MLLFYAYEDYDRNVSMVFFWFSPKINTIDEEVQPGYLFSF